MDAKKLHETLKPIQESKGFYFNSDEEKVLELLDALIINKERYGYMSCPCRLSSEDKENDRDIICPCEYREPDIAEFGSCYCNLYVSKEWNDKSIEHSYVPERRPPEKCLF